MVLLIRNGGVRLGRGAGKAGYEVDLPDSSTASISQELIDDTNMNPADIVCELMDDQEA